jgi:hypothetical protein
MTEEVEFQFHYGGLVMSSGSACPIGIGHPRNPMLGRGNLTLGLPQLIPLLN